MSYKILITGSTGTLSSSVKGRFDCIDYSKETLESSVKKYVKEHIFILHFAAETNVDLCEQDKLLAVNSNYVLTKDIVDRIREFPNAILVFISSASVFNGKEKIKHKEDDYTIPANFYAFTKLLSEQYIIQNLRRYYIFRFGWLIGSPEVDDKFIGRVFSQIIEKKDTLYGVDDVFGSITFADEFAKDLGKIFSTQMEYGIYNYTTDSQLSRFEIIKKILSYYDLNNKINAEPCSIDSFNIIANRPKFEILSTEKAKKNNLISELNWEIAMNQYLDKYRYLINGKV